MKQNISIKLAFISQISVFAMLILWIFFQISAQANLDFLIVFALILSVFPIMLLFEIYKKSQKDDESIFESSKSFNCDEVLRNVAHQWRQPLNVIVMIIQSFETKANLNKLSKEFIQKQVEEALNLANAMSQTIDDFRFLYSPNKPKRQFQISNSINDAIKLTKFFMDKNQIELKIDIKKDPIITSYKGELTQVLVGILNNAIDALCKTEGYKFIEISLNLNKFIEISITDNAGGIDESIANKIYEPYFTTKHQSIGTGIGLYMCRQIVTKHLKGKIETKNVILKRDDKEYKCARFLLEIPTGSGV